MTALGSVDFPDICDRLTIDFERFEETLRSDQDFVRRLSAVIKRFHYSLLDSIQMYSKGEMQDQEPNLAAAKEVMKIYRSGLLLKPIETDSGEEVLEEGLSDDERKRLGLVSPSPLSEHEPQ